MLNHPPKNSVFFETVPLYFFNPIISFPKKACQHKTSLLNQFRFKNRLVKIKKVLQMDQNEQLSRRRKYEELVAKFRQAYPPSPSAFSNFMSYVKNLSGRLIDSLSAFYKFFKTQSNASSKASKMQEMDNEEEKQEQLKRKGRILNFSQFNYNEEISEGQQSQQLKIQSFKKSIKSFTFKGDSIRDPAEQLDQNNEQDTELFLNRIGRKKLKVNPINSHDKCLIQTLINQPSEVTKHFNKICNQFTLQQAEILLEEREFEEKQQAKKSQNESVEQIHQKYLKKIGIDNQKDGIKGGYKRLCEMMKQRKEIVQKRPSRKKIHIEKDIPPIYCVEKVLEVLEIQKQQFFKQKRMKLQQELKETQCLERPEKQNGKKTEQSFSLQNQLRLKESKETPLQMQQKTSLIYADKANVEQNNHQSNVIAQKGILQVPNLVQNEINSVQHPFQGQSTSQIIQKPIEESNQLFCTPRKKIKPVKQSLLCINNKETNTNTIVNPFLNNNKSLPIAASLKLEEFMKKQPVMIFSQMQAPPQPQATIGTALFSKNLGGTNLFKAQSYQNHNLAQPSSNQPHPQNLYSPNNFISNSAQRIMTPQPTRFCAFNPQSVNNLNSSIKTPNINSSHSEGSSNFRQHNTILGLQSGSAVSVSPFEFNSFRENRPDVSKFFGLNLYDTDNPPTIRSLFGIPSILANKQTPSRVCKKNKNQIRIT